MTSSKEEKVREIREKIGKDEEYIDIDKLILTNIIKKLSKEKKGK